MYGNTIQAFHFVWLSHLKSSGKCTLLFYFREKTAEAVWQYYIFTMDAWATQPIEFSLSLKVMVLLAVALHCSGYKLLPFLFCLLKGRATHMTDFMTAKSATVHWYHTAIEASSSTNLTSSEPRTITAMYSRWNCWNKTGDWGQKVVAEDIKMKHLAVLIELLIYSYYVLKFSQQNKITSVLTDDYNWHCFKLKMKSNKMSSYTYQHFSSTDEQMIIGSILEKTGTVNHYYVCLKFNVSWLFTANERKKDSCS